jgi:hypothetical protein
VRAEQEDAVSINRLADLPGYALDFFPGNHGGS